MLNTTYLPFTIDDLGLKKSFEFNETKYKLRLRKNELKGFFTIDVFNETDEIIYTSNLLYKRYFVNAVQPDLPFQISAFDVSELFASQEAVKEITDETLGNEVKLYTQLEVV